MGLLDVHDFILTGFNQSNFYGKTPSPGILGRRMATTELDVPARSAPSSNATQTSLFEEANPIGEFALSKQRFATHTAKVLSRTENANFRRASSSFFDT